MRLAVWKGCVHEVPYCDLTCLGADGTDSSDPLVTRAHRVRIRVSVLLEQAQVQVEMLPSERRSTSVKGDLRAVADAADHRIHAHLIDPQRGIVVRRDRDRSRRSYQQLIWHRPVSRGFAWTVAIIVTRPSPALAPRQPGARPWAVLSLSRRTTAESTKGSTGLSRVPAGRCSSLQHHPAAVCRHFQPSTARRSGSGRTLNPKVAGSSPAGHSRPKSGRFAATANSRSD